MPRHDSCCRMAASSLAKSGASTEPENTAAVVGTSGRRHSPATSSRSSGRSDTATSTSMYTARSMPVSRASRR